MLGVSMSAITGLLVSEVIAGKPPSLDLAPYASHALLEFTIRGNSMLSRSRTRCVFLALHVLRVAFGGRQRRKPAGDPVQFQWGVKIPMRDGVKLNATLYRPLDQKEPLPCVFTLTPYISQSYHDRGMYFAAHGYVFLTIDVRGRGNSEGEFTPLLQEAKDGHDVVEWLGTQP